MGDDFVLIHLRSTHIYRLNRTAARLWELMMAGHGQEHILQQMLAEFDVTEEQLAREVDAFMSLLSSDNLVVE
jgi:hypothetical protein